MIKMNKSKEDKARDEKELNAKLEAQEQIKNISHTVPLISPVVFRGEEYSGNVVLKLGSVASTNPNGVRPYSTPMQYLVDRTFIDALSPQEDTIISVQEFENIMTAESVKLYQSALYDISQAIIWIIGDLTYNLIDTPEISKTVKYETKGVRGAQDITRFAYEVAEDTLNLNGIQPRSAIGSLYRYKSCGMKFLSTSFMSILMNRLMYDSGSPFLGLFQYLNPKTLEDLSNDGIDRYMKVIYTIFNVIDQRALAVRYCLKNLALSNGDDELREEMVNGLSGYGYYL